MAEAAPALTDADVLSQFFSNVMVFAADAQRSLTGARMVRGGSRCLAWAVEAGLPPQMAYTVAQTARYTGLTKSTLYDEINAGRLASAPPAPRARLFFGDRLATAPFLLQSCSPASIAARHCRRARPSRPSAPLRRSVCHSYLQNHVPTRPQATERASRALLIPSFACINGP